MNGDPARSRRLVGLGLLLVVFVTGLLAGAAIDRFAMSPDGVGRAGRRDDGHRRYVIDQVDLSAEQHQAIDAILDRRATRMRALWQEAAPRLDAISDSARAEIMDVLTPAQRADYERLLQQREAAARARRLEREDSAGTRGVGTGAREDSAAMNGEGGQAHGGAAASASHGG